MRHFAKNIQQFNKLYSTLRKAPEFKLVKFDANSKEDFHLFRGLIIENIEYSALQYLIPNIKNEVDIKNQEALKDYFQDPDKDKYLLDAYKFVTQNHDKSNLGYSKVVTNYNEFIGNAGWILHDVDEKGIVQKMERGIHLSQRLCSPDKSIIGTPNTTIKPRLAIRVMKDVLQQLEDNVETLNPDGELVSSILQTNKRSQSFTQKYALNVGEPKKSDDGTFKWTQKIGEFVSRLPHINRLADETIQGR